MALVLLSVHVLAVCCKCVCNVIVDYADGITCVQQVGPAMHHGHYKGTVTPPPPNSAVTSQPHSNLSAGTTKICTI